MTQRERRVCDVHLAGDHVHAALLVLERQLSVAPASISTAR